MTKLVAAMLATILMGVIGFYVGAGLARLGVGTAWAVGIALAGVAGITIAREWTRIETQHRDGDDK